MFNNQFVLKKYLDRAVGKMSNVQVVGGKYKFMCNVCGDDVDRGNRNPRGALIYAQPRNSTSKVWLYKCMNGGCTCQSSPMSASYWLYLYFPDLFEEFKRELLIDFASGKTDDNKNIEEETKEEEKKRIVNMNYNFTSILKDGEVENKAREYCRSRSIPSNIWKDFKIGNKKPYSGRLIIPFLNKKGNMYYFQARALNGEEPKYLNPKDVPKYRGVYNLFGVDWKKTIIVCEGPLDSLFLPNAIAVTGADVPEEIEKMLKDKDVLYLWDNDDSGSKNSVNGLDKGHKVFLWKKFLESNNYPKVKDINELLVILGKEKFELEELEPYFSNSVFDKIYL